MKQIIAFLVFWISFLSCQSEEINIYTQHVKEISKNKDGWNLVGSEEFEQESNIPNAKSWSLAAKEASPWNRYMSESYDQAYVKDGKLYLIAEKKDGEYKTGGVWTMDKVGFKYGKLEVCAKFTSFQGGWAAIWLMPQERQYPSVNNSYPGEIDIMEQVSMDKIAQHSVHTHYTLDLGYDKNPPRNGYGEYRDSEFNIYGIEWTEEKIIFTVNGEETFSYPNLHLPNESLMQQWPFDVPYYLILNYSVGGEDAWPGPIDDRGLPAHMEVEYVRYYEKENKGNDDDEEEEPSDNLIQNGNFEKNFAEDQQPGVFSADQTDQSGILNYLDRWFCRPDAPSCNMTIDKSEGANNSSRSLKYEATEIMDAEKVNLSYALQNVMEGRYTFSYYVKTNQDDTPFTLSIVVCETEDDIPLVLKENQKSIIFNPDGSQSLSPGPTWGLAATCDNKAGKGWIKYSVTVDIPENVLIRFVFKPCAYVGDINTHEIWGKGAWGGVIYWFDEFSLIPVE